MPRWPLVLLLVLVRIASAEDDAVEVDSIAFRACPSASSPLCDPLVFWTPGQSERVLIRARLHAPGDASTSRIDLSVAWGLLPSGAPLREASIVWSDPEELRSFDVPLVADASADLFSTIPIARRAREWQEAGLDVVACRVLVRCRAEATSATLDVIPADR